MEQSVELVRRVVGEYGDRMMLVQGEGCARIVCVRLPAKVSTHLQQAYALTGADVKESQVAVLGSSDHDWQYRVTHYAIDLCC